MNFSHENFEFIFLPKLSTPIRLKNLLKLSKSILFDGIIISVTPFVTHFIKISERPELIFLTSSKIITSFSFNF